MRPYDMIDEIAQKKFGDKGYRGAAKSEMLKIAKEGYIMISGKNFVPKLTPKGDEYYQMYLQGERK